MILIKASSLTSFIDILYLLCLGYNGIKRKEVLSSFRSISKSWNSYIPSLKYCIQDIKNGTEDYREELAQDIKDSLNYFKEDLRVERDDLNIITTVYRWLASGKESYWNTLVRKANVRSSIASKFLFSDNYDPSIFNKLKRLLKSVDYSFPLTLNQAKELKADYPDIYTEYATLNKELNTALKALKITFIDSKGGICDYMDLYDFLAKKGLEKTIPYGFTGQIDSSLSWLWEGEKLDSVPTANTYPIIEMNENNDGDWICKAEPNTGSGATRYLYTVDKRKQSSQHKFAIVDQLSKKIPIARKKWIALIKKQDINNADCISALVLELIFQTGARIGTPNNTTYGINTVPNSAVTVYRDENIQFKYKGKDSVDTKYIIKPKDLMGTKVNEKYLNDTYIIPFLLKLKEDKDSIESARERNRTPFFSTKLKNGNYRLVPPTNTNKLLRRLVGDNNVHAHKIRTFIGTTLFKDLLEKSTKPKTQQAADKLWKKVTTDVGVKLNHIRNTKDGKKATGSTAVANYIDPMAQIAMFIDNGFRVPKVLEKYLNEYPIN